MSIEGSENRKKTKPTKPVVFHNNDKDLTPEEIMEFPSLKGISQRMAEEIADTVIVFTQIVYNCFADRKQRETENETGAKVIALYPNADKDENEVAKAA